MNGWQGEGGPITGSLLARCGQLLQLPQCCLPKLDCVWHATPSNKRRRHLQSTPHINQSWLLANKPCKCCTVVVAAVKQVFPASLPLPAQQR
jgi:hypothetical protein